MKTPGCYAVPLELDILQRSAEDMCSETVRLGWADVVPPFRVFLGVAATNGVRMGLVLLGWVGNWIGFSSPVPLLCGNGSFGLVLAALLPM
jgi:hypothetical protein